MKLPVKKETNF